jgi:hypothetical protein
MILIGANIKGMENEDDEVILGREIAIIKKESPASQIKTFIKNNKEGLIGGTGGLVGGGVFGYGMEKLTEKTNEEGKKIEGWWSRNFTIVTMTISTFLGGALTGKYYGEKKGIKIGELRGREQGINEGKEIGKREAYKLSKEKRRNKYTSKIEEIQKRDDIDDIVKKFKIDEYLDLIKETENE